MEYFILSKDNLHEFLKTLVNYDLFAPVRKNGITSFEQIPDPEGVELDLENQPFPPKKIIYPQTETMFIFAKGGGAKAPPKPKQKERVIFGVRPCDARGLCVIDPVFEKDYPDPYYLEKRNTSTLIGIHCSRPYSNCFCTSVGGSPSSTEGLDILLFDLGDHYIFEVITAKGEQIAKAASSLLSSSPGLEQKRAEQEEAAKGKVPRAIDLKEISDKIGANFARQPIWEDLARKCISCGICTYTCPTCYCFDIQDEMLKGKGKRVRIWDSCMFSEYTLHASGHNPRPTRSERLRNRIYHKFKQNVEAYGAFGCVGCGRCINLCPVNVDLIENLQTIERL